MRIKKILILAPVLLIIVLLQSYFWVPTYDQQTRGNPERLSTYITASIGDASLLNPILSSDTASSTIESMVFEGLIDRDEELRFRGRLAHRWEIYQTAFFYVNESADIPGFGKAGPETVVNLIQTARKEKNRLPSELAESLSAITDIRVLPPAQFRVVKTEKGTDQNAPATVISIQVNTPARIKLTLNRVDQHLFQNLGHLLGKHYFETFSGERFLDTTPRIRSEKLSLYAKEILPATEHNPTIVFHLRPGVKFHDGHTLDAYDVKFTYESIVDDKNLSPRTSDYEPVKTVEAIDPLTVKIVYKRLYSPAIGTWGMGILPEHLLNREALRREAVKLGKNPDDFSLRQSNFNRHPIGSGPFKFREWKSDQYIVLDRFEGYWEGAPHYKEYIYRIIPDLLTQEMEFYAGTVDSYAVEPHQVNRLKADPRFQSFSGISYGYTYIGYNLRREPFNDVRVRRALGMAIDTEKIIKFLLYDQGERMTGPFVKQTEYYNQGIAPLPYDPEGALTLLEAVGWKKNNEGWLVKDGKRFQFTLITNSGNEQRKAVLAIAQDSWKKIGIDVRTDLLEWSVFIQERVNKLDFDTLVLGWRMGIDPDLYQIWHSSQTGPYQLNFVGFENPEADDLIIKIRQEYDFQKQVAYTHRLHQIIAAEQPYTFLYVNKWSAVLDRRIVIKEADADGRVAYRKIRPTQTGDYTFYFNKWIKLPEAPRFAADG